MYLALCGRPAFAITIATGKGGQALPMFSLRRLNGPAFAEVSADGGGKAQHTNHIQNYLLQMRCYLMNGLHFNHTYILPADQQPPLSLIWFFITEK